MRVGQSGDPQDRERGEGSVKALHCDGCGRVTGHKRAVGVGTVLGIVLTFGLLWLAIPFYPVRCHVCGLAAGRTLHQRRVSPAFALAVVALVLVVIFAASQNSRMVRDARAAATRAGQAPGGR